MPGVTAVIRKKTNPTWAQDHVGGRYSLEPFPAKIDAAQFTDQLGEIVKSNGGAAANAVALPVDALTADMPPGTVLSFGAAASKKFAKTTAWAYIGDTSLAVEALPTAIADDDEARFAVGKRGIFIPSGTLVGRTYTERAANTGFGPAVDTDDEILLVAFDVDDAYNNNDIELYRRGCTVAENWLPDWTTISANAPLLAKLRAAYHCILGSTGV